MTLLSARWYRVAGLRPRLVERLQVRRRRIRGETWMLLADRGTPGRHVRLNAAAYAIAGRFDGVRTVQEVWDHLVAQPGAEAPTQDEVIELLEQLRDGAVVRFDRQPDIAPALARLDESRQARRQRSLFSWRLRIGNPAPLLDRLGPLQACVFSRRFGALWLLAILGLLLQCATHAGELAAHAGRAIASPRTAALGACLYVPIKLFHELAHGLAVHRFGGRVESAGITWVLGVPMPWVDASAASAFTQRHRRVLVGVAGVAAELLLAALAMPLWLLLPEGASRDAMLVILLVCGVSTLLFNANPLQRLDGYYVATDLLELPNLATRSRRWWLDRLQRGLGTATRAEPMALAPGERAWLVAYAPLSWLCAAVVGAWSIGWLGGLSFALGCVASLLLGWQIVLRPLARLLGDLQRGANGQASTARRWRRLVAAGGLTALALLAVPMPQRLVVRGVVWPADDAQLRAETGGFVSRIAVVDNQPVGVGDVVLELANPALQTELERQAARVQALEVELLQAVPVGAEARAGDALAALAAAHAQLERLRERLSMLTVRAKASGRIALPRAAELAGRWLAQGQLIGHVVGDEPPTLRVALPESEAGRLSHEVQRVSVRLASSGVVAREAQLRRDGVAAVRQLPSAALSERFGGPVPTDPQDAEALKPLQPVVLLDVQLRENALARLGERAWVRFDTGFAPLALQAAETLRTLVLRRFNPQW